MSNNTHEVRDLKRRLAIANKTMGRQGATIANLRGELARIREENSKIDRGELRRLEKFAESSVEQIASLLERLAAAREENKRLREKLDGAEAALDDEKHVDA